MTYFLAALLYPLFNLSFGQGGLPNYVLYSAFCCIKLQYGLITASPMLLAVKVRFTCSRIDLALTPAGRATSLLSHAFLPISLTGVFVFG